MKLPIRKARPIPMTDLQLEQAVMLAGRGPEPDSLWEGVGPDAPPDKLRAVGTAVDMVTGGVVVVLAGTVEMPPLPPGMNQTPLMLCPLKRFLANYRRSV